MIRGPKSAAAVQAHLRFKRLWMPVGVLGVIPRERICVTPRARLGFHAAWHPGDDGHPVPSREATKLLMDIYPEHVRSWIARRGGLSPHMMFLSGRELTVMYRPCYLDSRASSH